MNRYAITDYILETLLRGGLLKAVYPCAEDKRPLLSAWQEYEGLYPNALRSEIVGGSLSKEALVIDIEGYEKQPYYRHLTKEQFVEVMKAVAVAMKNDPSVFLIMRTPSGGLHIFLRKSENLHFTRIVGAFNPLFLQYDLLPPKNNVILRQQGRKMFYYNPNAEVYDPAKRLPPLVMRQVPSYVIEDIETAPIAEGSRNDTLFRLLRSFVSRGLFGDPEATDLTAVDEELLEVLRYRCEPYYDEPLPMHAFTHPHSDDEIVRKIAGRPTLDYSLLCIGRDGVRYGNRTSKEIVRETILSRQPTPPAPQDEVVDVSEAFIIRTGYQVWENCEPPDDIVPNLLRRQTITLIGAQAKSGKSTISYQLAEAVAHGIEFAPMGVVPKSPARVLYIDLENDAGFARDLVWIPSRNLSILQPNPKTGFHFTRFNLFETLKSILDNAPEPYDVLIFDNIFQILNFDLNSASDTTQVMGDFLNIARAYNLSVVLIHHARKEMDGGYRLFGSQVFQNVPAFLLQLSRIPETNNAKLIVRGRSIAGDREYLLRFTEGRYFPEPNDGLSPSEARVLRALNKQGGFLPKEQITALADKRVLRLLYEKEAIVVKNDGFVLTRKGKELLNPPDLHPVWKTYALLRETGFLPPNYRDPRFVFEYYERYGTLPPEGGDDGGGTHGSVDSDDSDRTESVQPDDVRPTEGTQGGLTSYREGDGGTQPMESGQTVVLPMTEAPASDDRKAYAHIFEDVKAGKLYIEGKPYSITPKVLVKRGNRYEIERGTKGDYYVPQTVLTKSFTDRMRPKKLSELTVGTLDIETPTLQSGEDAEILFVGAGVRKPDGEEVYEIFRGEDSIYNALLFLKSHNIDVLCGHNLFGYDMQLHPSEWIRAGGTKRKQRFRLLQGEYKDYEYFAFREFAVVDTYLLSFKAEQAGVFKPTERGLHSLAKALGVQTRETKAEWGEVMHSEELIRERLRNDLAEGINVFLKLWQNFHTILNFVPVGIEDVFLRGNASLISYILIREALLSGQPIPVAPEKQPYEGALVRANKAGVYTNIVCADVASLYPSIMLKEDGCSHPLAKAKLRELTELRLRYKKLAKETGDVEYERLQWSLKILINSFYGFYGTGGLPFADYRVASNITAKGRELLSKMINRAEAYGATLVEADTDGIIVSLPHKPTEADLRFFEGLLTEEGYTVEAEAYDVCLLSKMKNYIVANFADEEIVIKKHKGSALHGRNKTEAQRRVVDYVLRALLRRNFNKEALKRLILSYAEKPELCIKSERIGKGVLKHRADLLTEEDVEGNRIFYYETIGRTKTGRPSYAQIGRKRVPATPTAGDFTEPPNVRKFVEDMVSAVRPFEALLPFSLRELREELFRSIPTADEVQKLWSTKNFSLA